MILKDFNEKLKENKDMQNSYVTLHRTLDTQIQALESATNHQLISHHRPQEEETSTQRTH